MALALIVAICAGIDSGIEGFLIGFGLTCVIGGAICIFLAVVLSIFVRKPEIARGLALAGGITLLIGTGACSLLTLS